ncbi:hypothetical protein BDD14_0444 [Edaphobacter modestus]|uniref:Uncharacterized protein n=2 Tax=Edaphobacter modestus TaxID=388466 RepID=A0A4Q7YMZ9_9BACT|nr:hypothetical protein BDD14_0444 [Edaphobacter modestus]
MQSFAFPPGVADGDFFLAVAIEIDTYLRLGNHPAIDYLWVIFSEHVVEAREMYELRYQNRTR